MLRPVGTTAFTDGISGARQWAAADEQCWLRVQDILLMHDSFLRMYIHYHRLPHHYIESDRFTRLANRDLTLNFETVLAIDRHIDNG